MAEEKTDREIAEGLDFKELKAVAKELNGAIDQYNSTVEEDSAKVKKARIVGAKKLDMFILWRDGVDALFDAEFQELPVSSVNYYNAIYDTEEAEPEETEPEETEPEETEPEETEPAETEPAEVKDDREGSSTPKSPQDFAALKDRLENPQSPTGHFDRMCLEGGTIEQILAKFLKFLSDSGVEFKSIRTISHVKSHIAYRQERGWIYEEEKGKIKLVGFEKE